MKFLIILFPTIKKDSDWFLFALLGSSAIAVVILILVVALLTKKLENLIKKLQFKNLLKRIRAKVFEWKLLKYLSNYKKSFTFSLWIWSVNVIIIIFIIIPLIYPKVTFIYLLIISIFLFLIVLIYLYLFHQPVKDIKTDPYLILATFSLGALFGMLF